MNEPGKWFNQSQPQTLQMGVMLLYINAAFLVLFGGVFFRFPVGLLLTGGLAAGGYGIANEQKWGYQTGVGAAIVNLALPVLIAGGVGAVFADLGLLLSVMFDVALVALLLHPHSREYQKIWFR
ncbi:MAG: hypothetical protein HYU28_09485 [Actinobacteria bacterium]|nr:hypothetical protein [Actinomycetota bacterium]